MENYTETQNADLCEKVFFHNMILTVISMLVCLIMLCSTTFAWFSSEAGSSSNALSSGSFALIISLRVNVEGDTTLENEIEPLSLNENNGASTYRLGVGTYLVTLELSEETSAKGHCVVEINGVQKYTEVIIGENTVNKDEYAINAPLSFLLEIVEEDTVVKFIPQWGIRIDSELQHDNTYSSSEWATGVEN